MQTIAIDGLFNARATHAQTPWLVRSGATDAVSREGAAALRALGVTVVVDLREPTEVPASDHGIPIRSVRIYAGEPPVSGRLEEIYETLLRTRGEALTAAVAEVADAEGAALVHCTAGKDRTGLVVALATQAAGDTAEQILDDYVRSEADVRSVREPFALAIVGGMPAEDRAETLRLHLESPREAMEHALAVIDEHGGAAEYLTRHGLHPDQLRTLRRKNAGLP